MAATFLILLLLVGGFVTSVAVWLSLATTGTMLTFAWAVVAVLVTALLGSAAMLIRASNRSALPPAERGYGYSTVVSLGGMLALFLIVVPLFG